MFGNAHLELFDVPPKPLVVLQLVPQHVEWQEPRVLSEEGSFGHILA